MQCLFCDLLKSDSERIVASNNYAIAVRDAFPVTHGHTLVIAKKHLPSVFDLSGVEILGIFGLLKTQQIEISSNNPDVKGFNVGVNDGEAAGQTIAHCHFHLIPRRVGDVPIARGGVRHVIPGKGDYING